MVAFALPIGFSTKVDNLSNRLKILAFLRLPSSEVAAKHLAATAVHLICAVFPSFGQSALVFQRFNLDV